MSLYAYEEVCKGCRHARWMEGERRRAFDHCAIESEPYVDHMVGDCPDRAPRTPPDSVVENSESAATEGA